MQAWRLVLVGATLVLWLPDVVPAAPPGELRSGLRRFPRATTAPVGPGTRRFIKAPPTHWNQRRESEQQPAAEVRILWGANQAERDEVRQAAETARHAAMRWVHKALPDAPLPPLTVRISRNHRGLAPQDEQDGLFEVVAFRELTFRTSRNHLRLAPQDEQEAGFGGAAFREQLNMDNVRLDAARLTLRQALGRRAPDWLVEGLTNYALDIRSVDRSHKLVAFLIEGGSAKDAAEFFAQIADGMGQQDWSGMNRWRQSPERVEHFTRWLADAEWDRPEFMWTESDDAAAQGQHDLANLFLLLDRFAVRDAGVRPKVITFEQGQMTANPRRTRLSLDQIRSAIEASKALFLVTADGRFRDKQELQPLLTALRAREFRLRVDAQGRDVLETTLKDGRSISATRDGGAIRFAVSAETSGG